jgi:hypothetical protein
MKRIAATHYYTLTVDDLRNRLIMSVSGIWRSERSVPTWFIDLKRALKFLSFGATALTNMSNMGPSMAPHLLVQAQKLMIDAGIRKGAEIHNDSVLIRMQAKQISEASGLDVMQFLSREDAVAYLDSLPHMTSPDSRLNRAVEQQPITKSAQIEH